jgi:hypothetical protein
MPDIDRQIIEETWRNVTALDPATASAEARRFAEKQPAVLRFVKEVLREFDEGVQGAALGLAYLLFKAVEAVHNTDLPTLSDAQIEEVYGENAEWLEPLGLWEGRPLRRLLEDVLDLQEVYVPFTLIETYLQRPGVGSFSEKLKGHLFLVIKTLFDCLQAKKES